MLSVNIQAILTSAEDWAVDVGRDVYWDDCTQHIFWDTLCRYRDLNCIPNGTFME